MKRTSLVVAVLVFVSVLFVGLSFLPEVRATTRYVGGGGPGNYTSIQAAIDDANAGDIVFVYSGTYSERVEIDKTLTLVGEDVDTTLIDGGGSGVVVYVSANWVNISKFTIRNSGMPLGAGIELYYVQNCTVTKNNVSDNWVGILLHHANNTTITNNRASNKFEGISLGYANNNTLTNNALSNNIEGISLYYSSNNTIANNTFSKNSAAIHLYSSIGDRLWNNLMTEDGILLSGDLLEHWNTHTIDTSNTVNGKPVYYWKNAIGGNIPSGAGQVILANSTGVTVENQDVSNCSAGIELGFSSSNTISYNNASNNVNGILLYFSSNNTIADNAALNNTGSVYFYYSGNNTLANNNVSNNWDGIDLHYSNNNTIRNNTASSNGRDGMYFYLSSNNTIVDNSVSNNRDGIFVQSYSNSNIIRNNTVSYNDHRGIYLFASGDNTITNNTVHSNGHYGISLVNSDINVVYHNNLIDNSQQANDETDTNQWDNGYPSGGNYWSDYAGVDDFSGPGQNLPGGDGIGDTPYVIDLDSEDRYPLMSPTVGMPHRSPAVLDAILSGRSLENVTLLWNLSLDDGKGLRSVVGYEIYRNMTYDPSGFGYGLIASLSNGTSVFVDNLSGEGDLSNYFYKVCAIDLGNRSACDDSQAGKFTRPLAPGPNLVSIPLIQSNVSIETVLQTVTYDKAWFHDSSSQEWKWHMTFKSYRRGLWNLNHTMGIWVNVISDCNLTVAGIVPAQTMIHLYSGWNLVSFPSFNISYSVSDLKGEIGATRVEGYDLAPPNFLRVLGDVEVLQAGYGYWVRVEADIDWIVEVS